MRINEIISRRARKALRLKRSATSPTDDPYLMGDEARHAGNTEHENPFERGTEDYLDWQKGWREAIVENFINPRVPFGRKGVQREPDASIRDAVHAARRYRSAEEYADTNNPVYPMNTDPQHIRDRYQKERNTLIQRWNEWQRAGYIPVSG